MAHSAVAIAHEEHSSPMTAGCNAASWSPEVISLYGDPTTILGKLYKFDLGLDARRVFILTVETNDEIEVGYYERTSPHRLTVKKWRGQAGENVSTRMGQVILENKGVHCVGEQSKAVVDSLPDVKEDHDVPTPVNARAAFSHAIRAFGDRYSKATIYLMC